MKRPTTQRKLSPDEMLRRTHFACDLLVLHRVRSGWLKVSAERLRQVETIFADRWGSLPPNGGHISAKQRGR